jgi:hypothetical protein
LQFYVRRFEVVLIPQNVQVPFFSSVEIILPTICGLTHQVTKSNHWLTITFPVIVNPNSKPIFKLFDPIFELFDPLLLNFKSTLVNESAIWFQLPVRA